MPTPPRILPQIARPASGATTAPGSKSDTHRALILAAHATSASQIDAASVCDDTDLLIQALEKLGVRFVRKRRTYHVEPPAQRTPFRGELDMGLAGTSYRFLLPLVATTPGAHVLLTGSPRLRERPIGGLVEMLVSGGAKIRHLVADRCPPVEIHGVEALAPRRYELSDAVSSQFVSAMLLNAPAIAGDFEIELPPTLGSRSYIEMTVQSLHRFGIRAELSDDVVKVRNARGVSGVEHYAVDGDASSATYFHALAAVTGGSISIPNLREGSPQGDLRFPQFLEQMGCQVTRERDAVTVDASHLKPAGKRLRAIEADLSDCPDSAPTLAVVAALAQGKSVLRGLASLPHKESDRLEAIAGELVRAGIAAEVNDDSLTITGGTPHAARIATHGDHRIAMAFALLSARTAGIAIEDPDVVSKSFPMFWRRWEKLTMRS